MEQFIDAPSDVQWLRETHLKGVPLPSAYAEFRSAIVQGNDDSPYALNLYRDVSPNFDADYLRITFDHAAPIYCECMEYDGKTGMPKLPALLQPQAH